MKVLKLIEKLLAEQRCEGWKSKSTKGRCRSQL